MNNLLRFDRNKILFNSECLNILTPPYNYQKNKNSINNVQEEGKLNLILNNKNNNLYSYSTKNSKGINLMFDYKNNINKKKKPNRFYNYTNDQSPNKMNYNNKRANKIEENKDENLYNFKKVNINKTTRRNTEMNQIFNKPSRNIVTKYYTNDKLPIKKSTSVSINFNLNSPSNCNNNIYRNKSGGRNKKLNKQFRSQSNSNMKYQTYSNLNDINKQYHNETELEFNKYSLLNNQPRITEGNLRNNLYFNITTSSNTYLNTENNINSRNISTKKLNSIHNKNYNLMNIDSSTERNNTYSNLVSEKMAYDNDIKIAYSRKNKSNSQYKNIKYSFKTKDSYILKENKINKNSLKQYYEQAFNDIINDNYQNPLKTEKNEYKFNNEDLYFKERLSTNHSTCTNEINKLTENEINSQIQNDEIIVKKNSVNPEAFHFYMVSYLQKGKYLGNKFN